MSDSFLRTFKIMKHVSSFMRRSAKVSGLCAFLWFHQHCHDTLQSLVTWYLRLSWLAQNTAHFQPSNFHWHGKAIGQLYIHPWHKSFKISSKQCRNSWEWQDKFRGMHFYCVYLYSRSTLSNSKINSNLVKFLSFLRQQVSSCACLNTQGLLLPYTEEGTPLQALSLSLYLPSIN